VEAPRLRLAPTAKEALEQCISQITQFRPLVAVMWHEWATVGHPGTAEYRKLGPHWGVGFYDAAKLPHQSCVVAEIDGIAFVFGFESDSRLDGATLHFTEGGFHVSNGAI